MTRKISYVGVLHWTSANSYLRSALDGFGLAKTGDHLTLTLDFYEQNPESAEMVVGSVGGKVIFRHVRLPKATAMIMAGGKKVEFLPPLEPSFIAPLGIVIPAARTAMFFEPTESGNMREPCILPRETCSYSEVSADRSTLLPVQISQDGRTVTHVVAKRVMARWTMTNRNQGWPTEVRFQEFSPQGEVLSHATYQMSGQTSVPNV